MSPAPVAQRIEHLTTDQKVWGSNPYWRAELRESPPIWQARDLELKGSRSRSLS